MGNEITGAWQDSAASRLTSATCGGSGTEVVYELRITEPRVLNVTTDFAETTADTVLYIRSSDCASPASEITCNNDLSAANPKSAITASLTPGVYYLVVDNAAGALGGAFKLRLEAKGGDGATCVTATDCNEQLVCRIPLGQTRMQCAKPVCSDGVDDDADGKIDYPLDPGCATPADDTETDECSTTPPGASCPKCSNGIDDDADTLIDYPADPECSARIARWRSPVPKRNRCTGKCGGHHHDHRVSGNNQRYNAKLRHQRQRTRVDGEAAFA